MKSDISFGAGKKLEDILVDYLRSKGEKYSALRDIKYENRAELGDEGAYFSYHGCKYIVLDEGDLREHVWQQVTRCTKNHYNELLEFRLSKEVDNKHVPELCTLLDCLKDNGSYESLSTIMLFVVDWGDVEERIFEEPIDDVTESFGMRIVHEIEMHDENDCTDMYYVICTGLDELNKYVEEDE